MDSSKARKRIPARELLVAGCLGLFIASPLGLAAQEKDLAQGRPAAASSSESAKYAPEKALDGDRATGWASGTGDPQWLRVDLGATQAIGRVVLDWGIASAKAYKVELSGDGKAWTEVASRSGMAAGLRTDELSGLKGKGRYLRVLCTAKAAKATQYSLRELSAFGPAQAAAPAASAAPAPKPAAEKKAAPKGSASAKSSGFFLDAGCGLALPLGDSSDALGLGVYPALGFGWSLNAGPGRLRLGLESGALVESTNGDGAYYQYRSIAIPAGFLLGFDLRLSKRFGLVAQASGGYSATLVYYDDESMKDLGILKPYAGAALDLRLDLGERFSFLAGSRFLAIFYDGHGYLGVSPELGLELRL